MGKHRSTQISHTHPNPRYCMSLKKQKGEILAVNFDLSDRGKSTQKDYPASCRATQTYIQIAKPLKNVKKLLCLNIILL